MKTVNSLSGGKTSSYMAIHYPADLDIFSLVCINDIKAKPKDKKLIQAVNDKLSKNGYIERFGEFVATAEDDKVLRVMLDLEQMTGNDIVWVRGLSFEELNKKRKSIPNRTRRFCTSALKIYPIAEFVSKAFPELPILCRQGIRMDEFERAKTGDSANLVEKIIIGKSPGGRNKWKSFLWGVCDYPLIKNHVFYSSIIEWAKSTDLVFPEDSNCVGCFWKRPEQLRKNFDSQPGKMRWFEKEESKYHANFKDNTTYSQISKTALQMEFVFGGGAGCSAGFCTD